MRSSEVSRTRGLIVDVPSLVSDDIRVAVAVHRFVPVMPVSILASLRDTSSLHPRIRPTAVVRLRTKARVSFKDVKVKIVSINFKELLEARTRA